MPGEGNAGRGCYVSGDGTLSVWLNASADHILASSSKTCVSVQHIFKDVKQSLELLESLEGIEFVKSAKYGFLTADPRNLGPALRATLQVDLPTAAAGGNLEAAKAAAAAAEGGSYEGTGTPAAWEGRPGMSIAAAPRFEQEVLRQDKYQITSANRLGASERDVALSLHEAAKAMQLAEARAFANKPPEPEPVQHRFNKIPIQPGCMGQLVAALKANSEEGGLAAQLDGVVGLLGVEIRTHVGAVIDERAPAPGHGADGAGGAMHGTQMAVMTHSRWTSAQTASEAAELLAGILDNTLKEFVTGPPSPFAGEEVWSYSHEAEAADGEAGGVPVAASTSKQARRLTTIAIQPGTFEPMLEFLQSEAMLTSLGAFPEGLINIDVIRVSEEELVALARYANQGGMDEASAMLAGVFAPMGQWFAAAPESTPTLVEWSFTPTL